MQADEFPIFIIKFRNMSSPLTITSNQAELTNFKLNIPGYFITLFLMYLMISLPVIAVIFIISSGAKPSGGLLLFSVAMGFGAYFFYRLAVWNKHGREKYIVENDKFIYQPEAKKISYKTITFNLENLVITVVNSEESVEYDGMEQAIAWLRLSDDQTTITTNIKAPRSLIMDLVQKFEDWGIAVEGNFESLHERQE